MGKQQKDGSIRFEAVAAQIKTMADGGLRVALDLPENETETAKELMDCRRTKAVLQVVIIPISKDAEL